MPPRAAVGSTSGQIGFVVIGKNEGERLKLCLQSLPTPSIAVYVDSGSSDGSIAWARKQGFEVVELDLAMPFTAARARNTGFERLRELWPDVHYVQFIDGDCELTADWPENALRFLVENQAVCAVFGRRRERFPDRSLYNHLCDMEWNVPLGESRSFGGDVLIRVDAFQRAGGYRNDLIAGEEPELCVRLRAMGWKIWRLDCEMTLHDAAILRFSQWWRRTVRSGYAFAQGARIHGAAPERHWVWESRRAIVWGLLLPLLCLASGLLIPPWGHMLWLIYPLQLIRRTVQISAAPSRAGLIQAFFELLSRFAEAVGQVKFFLDGIAGRQSAVIDYK